MRKHLGFLLLCLPLATAAAGCGSKGASTAPTTVPVPPTTSTTHAGVSPPPTAMTLFHVRGGELEAEVTHVPHTAAVATAALGALGVNAPVTISNGSARVQLGQASSDQVAEIVYTLTEFPSVQRVDVAGRTGLTRDDFAAYLPTIFVESPASSAEVPRTIKVTGSATVFEATLVIELVRDGTVLEKHTVTASEGAPARGTFETTLQAPSSGPATITAYAPSAENGTPQHQVDVPVTVTP
jgi:hypothetical protein